MNHFDPFKVRLEMLAAIACQSDPQTAARAKQMLAGFGIMLLPSPLVARVKAFTIRCERGFNVCPDEYFAITHAVALAERAVRLGFYVIQGDRRYGSRVSNAPLRLVA